VDLTQRRAEARAAVEQANIEAELAITERQMLELQVEHARAIRGLTQDEIRWLEGQTQIVRALVAAQEAEGTRAIGPNTQRS
jgi:hypothetical protein